MTQSILGLGIFIQFLNLFEQVVLELFHFCVIQVKRMFWLLLCKFREKKSKYVTKHSSYKNLCFITFLYSKGNYILNIKMTSQLLSNF